MTLTLIFDRSSEVMRDSDGEIQPQADEPSSDGTWRYALWDPRVGASVGYLWMTRSDWINRRVDRYEFNGAETFRCNTNIDLTIPELAATVPIDEAAERFLTKATGQKMRVIPLKLLPKGELSLAFDLRDESGGMVSRLRSEDCGQIGAIILETLARDIVGRELPNQLRSRLAKAAENEVPKNGGTQWKKLTSRGWGMNRKEKDTLFGHARFQSWFRRLAENYLLCVVIPGEVGSSHVIEMSHDAHLKEGRSRREKLGWRDWKFRWHAPAADAASYHFEITCPPGCEISALYHEEVSKVPDSEWPPIGTWYVRPNRRHAALVAAGCADGRDYYVRAKMRIATGGWLATAASSGLLITALLTVSGIYAARFRHNQGIPPTDIIFLFVTLLLVALSSTIAVLVRSDEHEFTSEMLRYLRLATMAMAAPTFTAVVALVFAQGLGVLRIFLIASAILAGVIDVLLFIAVLRPTRVGRAVSRMVRS
jgi:hypothetical protein